ncbi:DcmR-like sensory protein [Geodermatophilus tzadiensis]|uniref:DcmR-like sensory protein n=1 Tax=Geodermatophilus tzadiensis TaxID=1137988 RepID=A0A2T0TTN2_9ACTN|nr:sensor histidine kinase [Geodermatophilus tzadiensis]PRY49017.1 DcmR-like sensory protein [Geodermatophilus tzadiensis]
MTFLRPTGNWDGTRLAHEGFIFSTDSEVVERVVPFVLEGFARGEPVLVVAGERVRSLLARHLGTDLGRLATFAAAETWWRGGHDTLLAYDRDLRDLRARAPSWRLAAEPVWLAREDGREWSRFEAVANRCLDAMPYYSLCLHDAQRLPTAVLTAVARSHPLTWAGAAPAPQPAYEDPIGFLRAVQPPWTGRPGGAVVDVVTAPVQARRAMSAALPGDRRARLGDVVLATHEIVVNALRGSAFAELATWTDGEAFVVEVTDAGPGLPDETLGYVPPDPVDGPRGMWLAWSLADDAAVRTGPAGTAVRLYFRR